MTALVSGSTLKQTHVTVKVFFSSHIAKCAVDIDVIARWVVHENAYKSANLYRSLEPFLINFK